MATTLSQQVYEQLKREILSGWLEPGAPLAEAELVSRLQIGRTPVREALIRLQQESLVRIVPRRGAFVASLSPKEVRDLYGVREILEPEAVRLAAPQLTREEIRSFRARFEARVDGSAVAGPGDGLIALDKEFHLLFARKADNQALLEILARLHDQAQIARVLASRSDPGLRASWGDHLRMLAALERGDVEEAAAAMRTHLRRARREALLGQGTGPASQAPAEEGETGTGIPG